MLRRLVHTSSIQVKSSLLKQSSITGATTVFNRRRQQVMPPLLGHGTTVLCPVTSDRTYWTNVLLLAGVTTLALKTTKDMECTNDDSNTTARRNATTPLLSSRVSKVYQVGKVLGEGGFGQVCSGVHRESDEKVAIKRMAKSKTSEEKFLKEVDILSKAKHENIISLRAAFQTPEEYVMVTEVAEGGELYDRLIQDGTYSEQQACTIIKNTASALSYLHAKHVVHGDIKPENIVLTSRDDKTSMRLVDFGLATTQDDENEKPSEEVCYSGTIAYSAPELLEGKRGSSKSDIWSLGVVLYILIAGAHPFDLNDDLSDSELRDSITSAKYSFNSRKWRSVSPSLRDLIRKMLDKDVESRLSADEVLQHPWIKKN